MSAPACSQIQARQSASSIVVGLPPSKTGEIARKPSVAAAQPRCVSSTWPTFMRVGTPIGFRMMSTGVPSAQVRHVLDRQDAGDHALVAVAAGHLVALGDLALLGDRDAHQRVDAGRQLVGDLA